MRKFYFLVISLFVFHYSFSQTQRVVIDNTGSGTFTVPCGVTSITVEAWGAGASGYRGIGGGGGGAYADRIISVVPGQTINYYIGRGGGTYTTGGWWPSTIYEGENTSFGTLVIAEGGGRGNSLRIGGRESASVGSVKLSGGNGAAYGSGRGGSGGGGAAGSQEKGMDGLRATGNGGGKGGPGGNIGGGNGGDGGTQTGNGVNGVQPGGGGGESGVFGSREGRGGDGILVITYSSDLGNYCSPTIGNVEAITNVTFSNINNTTLRNSNQGVEIFCSPIGEVMQGETLPISVKGNTADTWLYTYTNYFTVFIDWNQDGDFDDPGERINIGTISGSTGTDNKTETTDITVPQNASLGLTKMRVIKNYNGYPTNACGTYTYGQAEDYIINVSGNCTQPTGILANGAAGDITVCEGTPVTLKQTGGTLGAGASWKWSRSCGGTPLNTNSKADAAYAFTPTTSGTYYLRAEGGNCGTSGQCKQVTITVNTPGTIKVTSGTKDFAACKGINNTSYASFTIGGGATGATVSGLPSGMAGTLSGKLFTIKGNPSATGTFSYIIALTGNASCSNSTITGTITVNEAPASVTYNTPVTYCAGTSITPNIPVITGGSPASFAVVGTPLPAGLVLNAATGEITGVPATVSGTTNYTIRASSGCGYKDAVVRIGVSDGNTAFNVIPAGIFDYCGTASAINMGLSGSELGVTYQLYHNDIPSGAAVAGTGNAVSFGTRSVAGTYTVKTTNGCISNMNGSTVINVFPKPDVKFSYPSYTFCKTGTTAPALTGTPQTGLFSATPAGLAIDAVSGVINLEDSYPGSYVISYTVKANGPCDTYTSTMVKQLVINDYPNIQEVYGGGSYCAGTGGLEVGLENSQTGVKYELYRNGSKVSPAKIIDGTGADVTFGNQTAAGIYTVRAYYASTSQCAVLMDGEAEIIMNQASAPITIRPATKTICQGEIVPLTASLTPPTTATDKVQSGSGNSRIGEIPNNDFTGISHYLRVAGVPEGATVTSVVVKFNISHSYTGDLLINLKGPNGKVLNLANGIGGTGKNFTNTTINSTNSNNISVSSASFTGTYAPQASIGVNGAQVVTANISNVTSFDDLFNTLESNGNGDWTLSVRDKEDRGYYSGWLWPVWNAEPKGYLENWEITINYTYTSNLTGVVWSPAVDLYTDRSATIPYTEGTILSTVYAKPSSSGLKEYTATSLSSTGCNAFATTKLTVNTAPVITVSANYCDYPGKVRITATSDIPVTNWKWSGGLGGSVSGNTSYIEPNTAGTFYVTAKSSSNSCTGLGEMSIAQELVTNGDFEAGNTGFSSDYTYVSNTTPNGLYARGGLYTVHHNPNFTHTNFWGTDHTTADGNGQYMIINGTSNKVVWKQTVTVIPNTVYYFSAYAVSLNNEKPFANLVFRVNNGNIGTETGALPGKSHDNNPGEWKRFYGNWNSGSNTTATIEIVNLQNAESGNDFGLDDISFGTLSTFFNLLSAAETENQSALCVGTDITEITYEAGGDGNQPRMIAGALPPGLKTHWNGRNFRIYGSPTEGGTFNFTLESSGCNPKQKKVKIVIDEPSNGGAFDQDVVSVCYDKNASVELKGTVGNVTQWHRSNDGGESWQAVSGTAKKLNVYNITSAVLYKAEVKNKSCDAAESPIVKIGIKNYWTGEQNRNFTNIKNWSDEAIPTVLAGSSCPTVVIPHVSNLPVFSEGHVNITNLQINTNASLEINQAGILGIAGTITNNGLLNVKDGTLEFNGTAAQTLSGSILTDKTIKNLRVNNIKGLNISKVAGDTLNILGALTFENSSAKINTGDNITLKSTAFGTAAVGVVPNNNTITGKFIVERFINTGTNEYAGSHPKSWQLLAAPVKGVSIRDSWQEGAVSDGKTPIKYTDKGYGTLLTSGRSNAVQNGFDLFTGPGPSIKSYDPDKNTYDAGPVSTADELYNPYGYMILVRGDRRVYVYNDPANPTVLRAKGNIQTGKTDAITVKKGKFQTIGNPYPSAINIEQINRTGLEEFIYIWDPYMSSYYGLGGFRTLYKTSNGYKATPPIGDYTGIIENIESGQAFFVKAKDNTEGSVYFTEAAKVSGSRTILRGQGSQEKTSALEINIYDASTAQHILVDGTLVQFGNFKNEVDDLDALKMENTSENLSVRRAGYKLALERRAHVEKHDTIFLNLTGVRAQKYSFELMGSHMPQGLEAWFEDSYLNTRTPLNLNDSIRIDVSIVNIPGSYASDRFRIVFKAQEKPVVFTGVSAVKKDEDIVVEWAVANENIVKWYEVEVSADGNTFARADSVAAANSGTNSYKWLDAAVTSGSHYYRIRSVDELGRASVSDVVKVFVEEIPAKISIYPNPIVEGTVNIRFDNQVKGNYLLRLINPVGQVMLTRKVEHAGGNRNEKLNWDYKMARGMYQVEITRPNGSKQVIKVVY